jgi:hypothetical protein
LNSNSHVPLDIIHAYTRSVYHVTGTTPFTLKIGHPSAELKLLFNQYNCDSAIYLTAWNPRSQILDEAQNKVRQNELEKETILAKRVCIPGFGMDPEGEWPLEASILILGFDLEAGKALGQKYDQNALVWCDRNSVPQLILLR